MAITTPKGEQIQFVSAKTGTHNLDTYLEAAEVGNRQLSDLLDDLFDTSTGVFKADNFQFRYDTSTKALQVRVGQFANSTSSWTEVTPLFSVEGTFSNSTAYKNFDLVLTASKDLYLIHSQTSDTTYSSESNFIAAATTTKIVDVSLAQDWSKKTDGIVDSTDYSSKAWAIGGTGVTDTASKGAAKEWATKTSGTVDGTNYSAKHWATTGTVQNVSSNMTDINNVAAKLTEIGLLGTSDAIADLAILGTTDAVADMNTLATADIVADMNLLATSANVTAMNNLGTNTNVTNMANLNASGVISNIAALSASDVISDMNTLATSDIISDLNTLATSDIVTDMNLLATNANVTAMANLGTTTNVNNMANLNASGVLTNIANLNASGVVANINALAASDVISDMNTLATSDIISDLNTLATTDIVTDMNLLATSANVINMASLGTSTNVTNMANLNASGVITNINNLNGSGVLSNIDTVATNISNVNSFSDQYKTGSSNPFSSPSSGDLWFDTTSSTLKVYGSSGFQNAGSTVNGTSARYDYVVGTNSGTYTSGSTTVFPAAYDVGYVDVYLNGTKLAPSDFTATNGSSITLGAAAATGDDVCIVGYGTFQVATALAKSGGTMTGNIIFNSTQTFDGRDVSADGTKLDGIETAATADQTAAEILTAIKTVDGAASGLDADLLDGQHGAYYAPIDSPALTGNPTATTQTAGNNSTRIATTAYADAAVAAIVGSAPSTLNTLQELGDALGDDANYAASTATALGTKAPLASAALTGTPTAPTASASTNTTQLATTAFVTTAVGNVDLSSKASLSGATFTGAINANGGIVGGSGQNITLTSNIGSGSSTAFSSMLGQLDFVTAYSDTQRGPNKIVLQEHGNWISGLGISNGSTDIYTGGAFTFLKTNNTTSFTTLLSIDSSGNLVATANVTAYSDERLKENITTIPNALEKVEAMRGVMFDKKSSGDDYAILNKSSGVIAQELEKIAPELVLDGEYKSVAYGNLVGYLIEAVKELSAKVKELEAK